MKFHMLFKSTEKLIVDNSTTILTAVGVAGTISTAVLAVRGGYKAGQRLSEQPPVETRPKLDVVRDTWTCFLPAVGSASVTIGAIICAHRISAGRVAAMTAAYSLSESKLKDYKQAVEEKLGITKKEQVDQHAAESQAKATPRPERLTVFGADEQLCFDSYSGRYFKSNVNELEGAANDVNFKIIQEKYSPLQYFYDLVGLDATAFSEDFGFDENCPMELRISTMMSTDDKPALLVEYDVDTIRRWNHFGV